jgi:tRNA A-37 threonylcarbamoyl transferase component Bud32
VTGPSSNPSEQPTLPPEAAARSLSGGPAESIGEYEIVEEIARGGMGVVYKARHVRLDRLVALKMVLASRLASKADVRRFYFEAESAAQLDHPNIVPIFDVGEDQGQPYFAMKLITGKSLAQHAAEIRGNMPRAAALVARVARAVHHAHERGILHRDLKPGNILIDEQGEPHVTDFGLARRHAEKEGMTQTGAVLGTPAYMPPEQASGKGQVTTASDVYSLGAILYELLTGRPPYVGQNPVEVLLQVVQEDVISPRSVHGDVDRVLERICMKCLSRDPGDRYGSAADLALDLERWSKGEPVSVQQTAVATLFWYWLKRNLRSAAATVLVGVAFGILVGGLFWLAVMNDPVSQIAQGYSHLPESERPWLAVTWLAPAWLRVAAFFSSVVILSCMGVATALVVRPVNREGAVASGLFSGIIAGITAFVISVGWGPLLILSVFEGRPDLELIANTAVAPTPEEHRRDLERLIERYPHLDRLPAGDRGPALTNRLLADQSFGIPWALCIGIGLALFMFSVPAVSATPGIVQSLHEKLPLSGLFLSYAEKVFPIVLVIALPLSKLIGYPSPELAGMMDVRWILFLVALLAVTFLAALWRWKPAIRVVFVTASLAALGGFGWSIAQAERYSDEYLLTLVRQQQFAEVQTICEERMSSEKHGPLAGLKAASIAAWLGDAEGQERVSRTLLSQWADTTDPIIADRVAKACLVRPCSPDVIERAARLADVAVRNGEGHEFEAYFQLVRGMASYRSDNFEGAVRWLHMAQKGHRETCRGPALAYEAMVLWHLGDAEQAAERLAQAEEIDEESRGPAGPNRRWGPSWNDQMILHAAILEARRLME